MSSLSTESTMLEIHKLDYQIHASQVFQHLQNRAYPVWLDSGYPTANHSRFDILASDPASIFQADTNHPEDVESFVSAAQSKLNQLGQPSPSKSIPFQGGLIGYLSYDLGRSQAGLKTDSSFLLSDGYFGLYLWAFVYDHHSQSAELVFHPECDLKLKTEILNLLPILEERDQPADQAQGFRLQSSFKATEDKGTYFQHIHQIKDYILAGDVYQVNYAQHFCADYEGSCASAYLAQRKQHPAPYSAFIGLQEKAVLSHSPEEFIQISGREVQTQPIKGTAPRAANPQIDQRNAEVLQSSIKDRAENLMIVDLLRNDLGKSCEPGSINVPKLFELQSFSNVHHLVSQIRGRLSEGVEAIEVLQQCHPGGSITGAPKRRSMQIIDELEAKKRSIYCGSIGFISCCGQANTNIAIRTMVADGTQIHCWGGGGIVADSDAEKEYQETLFKVGPMMQSLESSFLVLENKEAKRD